MTSHAFPAHPDRLPLPASDDEALGALPPLGADGRSFLAQRARLAIEDVALHAPGSAKSRRLALLADHPLGGIGAMLVTGRAIHHRGVPAAGVALHGREPSLRPCRVMLDAGLVMLGPSHVTLHARRSALLADLLAFGAGDVALRAHLVSLRAHLVTLRLRLVPLGADLVTLGSRRAMGRAVLLHLLAVGLALDPRMLAAPAPLTVPSARRTGDGPGEQRETQ